MGALVDCRYNWFYDSIGIMANMNDQELQWLLLELGPPTPQYNDGWHEWLGTQGYTGSYNDRWQGYLGGLGISGSLNDRMRTAFCDELFNTNVLWILADGTWVDLNLWLDNESWID